MSGCGCGAGAKFDGLSSAYKRALWAVIAINALWVVDSVALLFWPGIDATALGAAFVLAQAGAVVGFAVLQWIGVRRLR